MAHLVQASSADKLLAVAKAGSAYGASPYEVLWPVHKDEVFWKWRLDVQEIFQQMKPAPAVSAVVDRVCAWLSGEASLSRERTGGVEEARGGAAPEDDAAPPVAGGAGRDRFLTAHWRRGDRGHSEMGAYGQDYWQVSRPENFGCLINRMVLESGIKTVFVATNSGSHLDKLALRDTVYRGSGGFVIYWEDIVDKDWRAELEHMLAEVFVCARGEIFLSAGRSLSLSSDISKFVLALRLFRARQARQIRDEEAHRAVAFSTRWLAECALPAAHAWLKQVTVSVHTVAEFSGMTVRLGGLSNDVHYRVLAIVSADCTRLLEIQLSDTFPSEPDQEGDEPRAPGLFFAWKAQGAGSVATAVTKLAFFERQTFERDPTCVAIRLSCPPHNIFDLHASRCPPLMAQLVVAYEPDATTSDTPARLYEQDAMEIDSPARLDQGPGEVGQPQRRSQAMKDEVDSLLR